MNGLVLVESKTAREEFIDRDYVLDKVKALKMLPDDLHVTVSMAAEYYEVGSVTIRSVINRHKKEFESDGYKVLKGRKLQEFKDFLYGSCVAQLPSEIKNSSVLALLPRRAVLRLGMLLQESEVARRVRDYLLDTESKRNEDDQEKEELKKALLIAQQREKSAKEILSLVLNRLETSGRELSEMKKEVEFYKERYEDMKATLEDFEFIEDLKRKQRIERFIKKNVDMKVLTNLSPYSMVKLSYKFAYQIEDIEKNYNGNDDVDFNELQETILDEIKNLKKTFKESN